jgi:hypothetical protein
VSVTDESVTDGDAAARYGFFPSNRPRSLSSVELTLLAVTIGCLFLKLVLITRINIHWDEFYYLSFIHDFQRGVLSTRLQTFHVHLFYWLTTLSLDEIGQVITGRLVMGFLGIGTAGLLYWIARHFMDRPAALFGVFVYVSSPTVIEHGASFRVDPLITFLVLAAVALILRAPRHWVTSLGSGIILALAALLTIKAVFFIGMAGLLILYLVYRQPGRPWGAALCHGALFGTALVASAGVLYFGHTSTLTAAPDTAVGTYLQGTATKVLLEEGLLPRWKEVILVLAANVLLCLMALDGARIAWRRRQKSWVPIVLALPLLTLLFYRNAYAYFFVLLLPAAAILAGLSFEKHRAALGRKTTPARRRAVIAFCLAQCVVLIAGNARYLADTMAGQRTTLAAIHEIFTKPVAYVDGYGVIASFPRVGFFMSSWGMDQYRAGGRPVFGDIIAAAQPPLLLADSVPLYHSLFQEVETAPIWHLLDEDRAFLQDNYVQHWGLVFVAGKDLRPEGPNIDTAFDVAIAGDYRVEATESIWLDGAITRPGAIVTLTTGPHFFRSETTEPVTLRWAAAAPAPAAAPVDLPDFFGIGRPRN